MILAYETSTNICSVAFQNNTGVVVEKRIQGRSVHSDNLFLFTEQLMDEHNIKIGELEAVLISNGPGSYTGLRIAASAIKGLLLGTNTPLFAINTLASFAMGVKNESNNTIHSIIDARRSHVYHQSFKFDNGLLELTRPEVIELTELAELLKPKDVLIGTGIDRIEKDLLENVLLFDDSVISACTLIDLFRSNSRDRYCIKTRPEELNSNYISSSQVNNSTA